MLESNPNNITVTLHTDGTATVGHPELGFVAGVRYEQVGTIVQEFVRRVVEGRSVSEYLQRRRYAAVMTRQQAEIYRRLSWLSEVHKRIEGSSEGSDE